MKTLAKLYHFIIDLILWLIAYLLTIPVELATFIIVVIKYGIGALDYFQGEAYSFDVKSASRNRSLWNWLFVNENGYKFTADTKKSISWHIGINSYINGLTWFGWLWYYILYAIDYSNWRNGGHCRACVELGDIPEYYQRKIYEIRN